MHIILEIFYEIFPFKRRKEKEQFDRLLNSIPVLEKTDPKYLNEDILPGFKLLLQQSLAGSKWDVFRFKDVEKNAQALDTSLNIAATFMQKDLIKIDTKGRRMVQAPHSVSFWRGFLLTTLGMVLITVIVLVGMYALFTRLKLQNSSTALWVMLCSLALLCIFYIMFLLLLHDNVKEQKRVMKMYKAYISSRS